MESLKIMRVVSNIILNNYRGYNAMTWTVLLLPI